MLVEFVTIILTLFILVQAYIIWNLNKKIVEYENRVEDAEKWIRDFSDTVRDVDTKLKEIDSSGTFEADDEVGTFFITLKTLMGQITDYWEK